MRKILGFAVAAVAVFLIAMQFLQQQRLHLRPTDPSATMDARLHPSPEVQTMLHESCYNCHSEQGERPWYSKVWPASVLLQTDVREARARLDFSEWDRLSPEMSKIRLMDSCRMMTEGKMPVWYYRPMHPTTSTPDPTTVADFCQWVKMMPTGGETAQLQ